MTIADSDALRMRRLRKHKAGDHSLCVRCAAVRTDPLGELRQLAVRLAAAHRADPANALLARELRMTLLAIAPHSGQPAPGGDSDDPDDELRELFAELGAS